jgi:hypothetical protein
MTISDPVVRDRDDVVAARLPLQVRFSASSRDEIAQ